MTNIIGYHTCLSE